MGIIKLENIRVFAHHGCLTEETKIGSDYRVDLKVKVNLQPSAITDKLNYQRRNVETFSSSRNCS